MTGIGLREVAQIRPDGLPDRVRWIRGCRVPQQSQLVRQRLSNQLGPRTQQLSQLDERRAKFASMQVEYELLENGVPGPPRSGP